MAESGTVLKGRYRLRRTLGHGTYGEVWLADDRQSGRKVAVKVMLSTHSDPARFQRFEREVRLVARLRHQGIVQVFDDGWHDNHVYIVMELLEGPGDLAAVMRENARGLPVVRAVDLTGQIADALASVHAEGIIHRDIKPANMFVQYSYRLKLLDFGISRDFHQGATITQTGQAVGTPAYMAPELWEGGRASEASDLYAVGCVLYEMLTGRSPFAGASALGSLYQRHKDEIPAPPSARRGDVSATLDSLVLDLLAKSPRQRPACADEVAKRLRDIGRSGHEPRFQPPPVDLDAGLPTLPAAETVVPVRPVPARPLRTPGTVTCASISAGHLELFVLQDPDRIGRTSLWPDSAGVDWQAVALPRSGVTAVAAGSHDEDHAELAAVVGDTVYHRRWMSGQSSGWDVMPPLGARIVDVAFASMILGRLEVFVLDGSGRMSHREWPEAYGGWSEWEEIASPDGQTMTVVAAGSHSVEHEDLFTITGGSIWQKTWGRADDGFSDWSEWRPVRLTGVSAVDLACTSSRTGHLALFVLGASGEIHSRAHSPRGGWSEWASVSVPDRGQVTAIAAGWHAGTQQAALFGITGDGAMHWGRSHLGGFGQPVWSWREIGL